jgi:hypothetical protein
MVTGLVQLIPVIWHFTELSTVPNGRNKEIAVADEVSNVTAIIARAAYCAAVNNPNEAGKVAAASVMLLADQATVTGQIFEAARIYN